MKFFLCPASCNEDAVSMMAVTPTMSGKTACMSCTVLLAEDACGYLCLLAVKNSAQQIIQQMKIKKNLCPKQCRSRL